MIHSPGTLVRFKAAPQGPIAAAGTSRMIRQIEYVQVMWTDATKGFQVTEVPAEMLISVQEISASKDHSD